MSVDNSINGCDDCSVLNARRQVHCAKPNYADINVIQFFELSELTMYMPPPKPAIRPTLSAPASLRLSPKPTIELNFTFGAWLPSEP